MVDEAYMDKLFHDVNALYRLDQISSSISGDRRDLGPLPSTSVALLTTLAVVWILILLYAGISSIRKRRRKE